MLVVCGVVGAAADAALVPFEHATNAFPPTLDWVAFQSLVAIAAPALCLAYASAFALAWFALEGRFPRQLAPIGRIALTSYISRTRLHGGLRLSGRRTGWAQPGCLIAAA